jgi:hypothetical protein
MPLWLILLGGAALVWYWRSNMTPAIIPGALKYTVNAPSAYYSTDPSVTSNAVSAGTLPAGTLVYSTVAADAVFSNDGSYEYVTTPSNGNVWIQVSNLTQTQ